MAHHFERVIGNLRKRTSVPPGQRRNRARVWRTGSWSGDFRTRPFEAQGGTLRAKSEEVAKGATFVLDCPCKFVTAGRIPRSDSPHGMTADRPDFYPLRIFVIEDHRDTLEALQISLERSGHVVFSARSKAEAHREIPRANCHVLISDINLPDGNGWDLMQELGKLCPDYAIAISGYGMKADRERSAESGFRHHLVKPVSAQKLDTLLQEATTELKEKEK